MMKIEIEKPVQGKRERVCHICSKTYVGWNFAVCLTCEQTHAYEIVRK